jgi:hypothetical protein
MPTSASSCCMPVLPTTNTFPLYWSWCFTYWAATNADPTMEVWKIQVTWIHTGMQIRVHTHARARAHTHTHVWDVKEKRTCLKTCLKWLPYSILEIYCSSQTSTCQKHFFNQIKITMSTFKDYADRTQISQTFWNIMNHRQIIIVSKYAKYLSRFKDESFQIFPCI